MTAAVDHVAKARAAWGEGAPGWVIALARACADTSQAKVAARLGVSGSLVSSVLAAKYPGDMVRIAELCTQEFEHRVVDCPVLGEITPRDCRGWQAKAKSLRTSNNQNARMFRACNHCPRHRREGQP